MDEPTGKDKADNKAGWGRLEKSCADTMSPIQLLNAPVSLSSSPAKSVPILANNSTSASLDALNDLNSVWPESARVGEESPSSGQEMPAMDGGLEKIHHGPTSQADPHPSRHHPSSLSPRESRTLLHGLGGEYLVMADLALSGYRVIQSAPGCAYDLLVELDGPRYVRVQVKSTHQEKTSRPDTKKLLYKWELRRGNNRKTSRFYADSEFEIVALVATDIREIAYIPKTQVPTSCIKLRSPTADIHPQSTRGRINDYPFSQALSEVMK